MLLFGKKIFSIVKFLIDVEVFEMIYIILYIKEQFKFKEYFLKIIICEKKFNMVVFMVFIVLFFLYWFN